MVVRKINTHDELSSDKVLMKGKIRRQRQKRECAVQLRFHRSLEGLHVLRGGGLIELRVGEEHATANL